MMKIIFTGPGEVAEDGGVIYFATVDGKAVKCHFTFEALQDVDPDNLHGNPMEQFQAHKLKLLAIAQEKIEKGLGHDGLINVFTSDIA
jgi:Protein of unknown function (DUF1488)